MQGINIATLIATYTGTDGTIVGNIIVQNNHTFFAATYVGFCKLYVFYEFCLLEWLLFKRSLMKLFLPLQ